MIEPYPDDDDRPRTPREIRREQRRSGREDSEGNNPPNRLSSRTEQSEDDNEQTDGIIWSRVIISGIIAVPIITVVLNHYPTDMLVAGLLVCFVIGVIGALIEE